MRRETGVFLIALLCAALAFVIFQKQISKMRPTPVSKTLSYTVAAVPVAQGTLLKTEHVRLSPPMPLRDTEDLFLQPRDAAGFVALAAIPAGEPVLRSKVEKPSDAVPKSKATLPIPEDMRALTISSANISDMPDLIEVGRYADLMGYTTTFDGKKEMDTLVHSAQIISLDQDENSGANRAKAVRSVTFALLPNEVETLLNATASDKVRIVLRESAGKKPGYRSSGGTMEIIRGVDHSQKSTVRFSESDTSTES